MSEVIQWIIAGLLVAAAVVYLVKRLKPTDKGCCAGCPYAGSCQHKEQRIAVRGQDEQSPPDR